MSSIRMAYIDQTTASLRDEDKKTSMRLASDANNPVDLLEQLIAILDKEKLIEAKTAAEHIRGVVKRSWETRSTVVTWDWKPAARYIKAWIEKTYNDTPVNVWMEKYPGAPIRLYFQLESGSEYDKPHTRSTQGKFNTLRKHLGQKFGVVPDSTREDLYHLPDGHRVTIMIFSGNNLTPSNNRLASTLLSQ